MIDPEENDNLRPCDRDLLKACSDLDEERVRAALDAGADPNCHDRFEWPLLACLHGSGFERWFWGWTDADDDDDDDDESVDAAKCEEYERESDLRRIRIFTILLDRGADINLNIGDDLLWHAVHNSPEIVEFLLSRGADPNCESDNGQNHDMNPLSHAWTDETVYRSDPEASKSYATIGRMLLSYGARPEWSGDFKETAVDLEKIRSFEDVPPLVHPALPENVKPLSSADGALFAACDRLDESGVERALAAGANPNARNPAYDYGTPLLAAVKAASDFDCSCDDAERSRDAIRIAKRLLSAGADPNLCEASGTREGGKTFIEGATPLQHAAWLAKDVSLSECLLEHGANPNFACSTQGGEEATVMSMNCWDYNVDDPSDVKPVEVLLARYGGCRNHVFDKDECAGMRDVDAALVFACQRLDYYNVQLAEKLGGDLSIRDGKRSLPVVVLDDAPQLCGKRFADNGWPLEDAVTDFLLFLLVGMKTPVDEEQAERILRACVDNGYADTMRVLVRHHSLGPAFKSAASSMDVNAYPWDCWPEEKRKEMATALFERDLP